MIKKHLIPSIPCIEFGASIGYISNVILSKIESTKSIVLVEASPENITALEANVGSNRRVEVVNSAISYNGNSVLFSVGKNNLSGKILDLSGSSKNSIQVRALKLCEIPLSESRYSLVMDIEGAEYELIGDESIQNCMCIIAELHGVKEQKQAFINYLDLIGLKLVDEKHSVYVFKRESYI